MMTTTGSSSARHNTSRFPFTASQWQELEHQALIFKYMVSGMPIPPDLLFTIKTSFDSKFHLHQPQHIGWNCFQMGFGRKIDPEPGRCRRTDGKKWRCSKEAYPDSKYCERHMHRGRNRSRKPVETTTTTTLTSDNNINNISSLSSTRDPLPTAIPISSITRNSPTTYNNSVSSIPSSYNNPTLLQNPFHFPNSSSLRPSAIDLESGPYSQTHKDYRSYGNGMKEEIDEHAFFSESSGTMTSMSGSSVGDSSWHLEPLTMAGSGSTLKQRTCSGLQSGGYSYLGLTPKEKQDQQQHYYVLDDDVALKMNRGDEPQKVMHHFFDEWPKNKDSWLETEDRGQASTTQLSISMPKSSPYDFFMTHNEK